MALKHHAVTENLLKQVRLECALAYFLELAVDL